MRKIIIFSFIVLLGISTGIFILLKKEHTPAVAIKKADNNKVPLIKNDIRNTPKTSLAFNTRINNTRTIKKPVFSYPDNEQWEEERELEEDRPDLAIAQDFELTKDPVLGKPTPERLTTAYDMVKQFALSSKNAGSASAVSATGLSWTERGPSNVGGRTRAFMFDPNDASHKKVWAGGVGGGLWYTNDITVTSPVWNKVDDLWANLAITCITYDPSNTQVFYVGTGEGWQNLDAINGAGIWKTTDGGSSWSQLSASTSYSSFQKLIVATTDGTNYYLYAASNSGVLRSTNGGSSFTNVASAGGFAADLDQGADKTLYASFGRFSAGSIYTSTNGTTWTKLNNFPSSVQRVRIATAPSDANVIYAMAQSGSGNGLAGIYYSSNKGSSWTTCGTPVDNDSGIGNEITRGQAWYDLSMAVDPKNAARVYIGGVDLFKSTNNGSSWTQISNWTGTGFPLVHADQHNIVFKPGSSDTAMFTNDGGLFLGKNLSSGTISFANKNTGYNVTQFYSCAMKNTSGANYFLAGAQDNGSHKFTAAGINSTSQVTGGDGSYCFIDQDNSNYQITSYVYDQYYLSTNGGSSFPTSLGTGTNGSFINPADYDDAQNILFCNYASNDYGTNLTSNQIERISGIGGTTSTTRISVTNMTKAATHIRVSPYATSGTSTIFVGTSNGQLFKVTNAHATPTTTTLTGSSFPNGSISCVEVGASENELLVTFSNYGVTSVFYTSNGGTNWKNIEGNLPNMPVRWALFNPNNRQQVMLATEVGVWICNDISVTSPSWSPSNSGLANVRVDMLQIRNSDNLVIAATHGRGLFSTSGFASTALQADFNSDITSGCPGTTVQYSDASLNGPLTWQWTFPGGTPSSSTVQNPTVTYASAGSYNAKLVVTKASEKDSVTKTNYITITTPVADSTLPINQGFESLTTFPPLKWSLYNQDNTYNRWDTIPAIYQAGGFGQSNHSIYIYNDASGAVGSVDELILPSVDLSATSNFQEKIIFNHAYAVRSKTEPVQDTLSVYYHGCDSAWILLWKKGGVSLSTATVSGDGFVPNSSQWRRDTIDITNLMSLGVVKFKFQQKKGNGNDLFLDNINIFKKALPKSSPAFTANKTTVCVGDSITFTDQSNNSPTAWLWTLNGGTPSSSSLQNPTVYFNTAGTYSITLKVTNGSGDSSLTKTNYITVNPKPSTSAISGNSQVCFNSSGVSYSVTKTNGSTYKWIIIGGTQASGTTTNAITVNWGGAGNGKVKVIETNSGGCIGDTISLNVQIDAKPVTSVISGQTSVCANSNNVNYSVVATSGSTYNWVITGGTQASGTTTNAISVNWGSAGTGKVKVVESSSTGCKGDTVSVTVTKNPVPVVSSITGKNKVCANSTGNAYSVTNNAGSTYNWTISGGTKTSGGNSNAIVVTWANAGTGIVSVSETNSFGCQSNTFSMNVDIQAKPATSAISGKDSTCANTTLAYSVVSTNGSTYKWIISGGTQISGTTTNAITINWANAGKGSIAVIETSSGACTGDTIKKTVTILGKPITSKISGNDTIVCNNSTNHVYSVSSTAGSSYKWIISGGTQTGGGTSSSIMVSWGSAGNGKIKVVETSSTGCIGDTVFRNIVIKSNPVISSISGNAAVCANAPGVAYSVTNNNGSTYEWIINGGTKASGGNTASISVNWGSAGSGSISVKETNSTGCIGNTFVKNIDIQAKPNTSAITGKDTVCSDAAEETYSVSAHSGTSYQWIIKGGKQVSGGNSNSISIKWENPGNGSVKVLETTSGGCSGDTMTLSVFKRMGPSTSIISGDDTICTTASEIHEYSVVKTAGSTYNWIIAGGSQAGGGDGENTITVDWTESAEKYNISVIETNNIGCIGDTVLMNITKLPAIQVSFTASDTVKKGMNGVASFENNSLNGNQYVWNFGDGSSISTEMSPDHTYKKKGHFLVTLYVSNGFCVDSFSKTIFVDLSTGIEVNRYDKNVTIYPIPVQSSMYVDIKGWEISQWEILDMTGKMVYMEKTDSRHINYDIGDLNNGMYLIKIKTQNEGYIIKPLLINKSN